MAALCPLEERDIAEVVRLFEHVYPGARWPSQAECESYFRDIFFGNPWVDSRLPSWVAYEKDRSRDTRIVGFIGVMPRPMRHEGRSIQAAVVSQLMVDRDKRHGLAAAQLLRKALAGPQELTLSDGANDASRKMWEALGGSTSVLYGMSWQRPLRPVKCALQLMAGQGARATALLAAPLAAAADAYVARRTSLSRPGELLAEPLDAASLLAALQGVAPATALKPDYDFQSLHWLLAQAGAKRRHGELQARLLRQRGGRIAGWFLYYLNGGTSKVLQLEALKGSESQVLGALLHHAWQGGASAIEGRLEPRFARTMSQQHCFFRGLGAHALIHARDAAVLGALQRGDAFFSRLEGEWWMRFTGEPHGVAARPAASDLISRLRFSPSRAHTQPAWP